LIFENLIKPFQYRRRRRRSDVLSINLCAKTIIPARILAPINRKVYSMGIHKGRKCQWHSPAPQSRLQATKLWHQLAEGHLARGYHCAPSIPVSQFPAPNYQVPSAMTSGWLHFQSPGYKAFAAHRKSGGCGCCGLTDEWPGEAFNAGIRRTRAGYVCSLKTI